jgi:hypothetical protein
MSFAVVCPYINGIPADLSIVEPFLAGYNPLNATGKDIKNAVNDAYKVQRYIAESLFFKNQEIRDNDLITNSPGEEREPIVVHLKMREV